MSIEQKDVLKLLEAVPKLRPLVMRWAACGERLKNWMRQVGVFPESGTVVRLGSGHYTAFADCRGVMDVIMATRLGGGQKAQRHLGVVGIPCAETSRVSVVDGEVAFQDIELVQSFQPSG